MIKKLTEIHKGQLMDYLAEEKEMNLFFIGDIENHGFNTEFQELWGDFSESEELSGVLLRYHDGFLTYSKGIFDVKGFTEIIKSFNYKILSSKREVLLQYKPYFDDLKKRDTYFAKLDHSEKLDTECNKEYTKKTYVDDLEKLRDLMMNIAEFRITPKVDRMIKNYEDRTSRGYHVKDTEGNIVASAETTAENSMSAMVMAVCTDASHRGKGYATQVVSKLCSELLGEGKTLCLFYDNPKAGEIYKRLGFVDIGIWSMWSHKK